MATSRCWRQALASICAQDYPCFQLVCGVQDPADPAMAVVRRLRARFPGCDIALVVDPRRSTARTARSAT